MSMKQVILDILSELRCFIWTKLVTLGAGSQFYSIQTLRLKFREPSALTQLPCFPKNYESSNTLPQKNCNQKGWKLLLCFISLSTGKRERTGGWWGSERGVTGSVWSKLHIQGEHCLWLLSQRPDKSRDIPRAQWRGQTYSEKDRDLHHNIIHMHSSELRHEETEFVKKHVKPSYASVSLSSHIKMPL